MIAHQFLNVMVWILLFPSLLFVAGAIHQWVTDEFNNPGNFFIMVGFMAFFIINTYYILLWNFK